MTFAKGGILSALLCGVTTAWCSGAAASTDDAILRFQQDTATIIEQAHGLNRKHAEQMEEFSRRLDDTQSALAVLGSPLIPEMKQTAAKMLALGNQYLIQYQRFLGELNKSSECYQPRKLDRYRQISSELQDYLDSLESLTSVTNEGDAFAALMTINLGQTRLAMLVDLLNVAKICYLSETAPSLAADFQALDGALAASLPWSGAILASLDDEDPPGSEQGWGDGAEDVGDDAPPLPPPLVASPPQSTPIAALTFSEPSIGRCIRQAAEQFMLDTSDEVTTLSCQLSTTEPVTLADLTGLSSLQALALAGGNITDLTALAPLARLELLQLEGSRVERFEGLDRFSGNLSLSAVHSQDWQALARSQAETISIMAVPDCSALAPLARHPGVALLYRGLDPYQMADLMEQVDRGEKSLTIMTDCSGPALLRQ
ncbi:hypothetical protein FCL40_02555 [Ferrimonas sediminicola]|uniref:Uncharacterized protein n=1 Tax=Ferrimonas sediminicola TaxID=2569538 RepID=A0A4U1BJU7_9GAMM|nr:hypothetical protein [Ferrimonas sediminicola]TKB51455.1 hypothetical protein FCL40_02555 [Ferrimonas sediminicola]